MASKAAWVPSSAELVSPAWVIGILRLVASSNPQMDDGRIDPTRRNTRGEFGIPIPAIRLNVHHSRPHQCPTCCLRYALEVDRDDCCSRDQLGAAPPPESEPEGPVDRILVAALLKQGYGYGETASFMGVSNRQLQTAFTAIRRQIMRTEGMTTRGQWRGYQDRKRAERGAA
jgi:hypothetical protein